MNIQVYRGRINYILTELDKNLSPLIFLKGAAWLSRVQRGLVRVQRGLVGCSVA
jgi:hypothetical protein